MRSWASRLTSTSSSPWCNAPFVDESPLAGLPVLVITSAPSITLLLDALAPRIAAETVAVLAKSFSIAALATCVDRLLGGGRAATALPQR